MKPSPPQKPSLMIAAFLAASLIALGAVGCRKAGSDAPPPRTFTPIDPSLKHVIIISIDTLRKDHLGCYDHPFVQTPHIDTIAQEGWRFTRCYAAAPTTLASHTAMLTGTYPHTHGTPRNGFIVSDDNDMLAEVLKTYGFTTAGFAGSYALSSETNFNQGFDHYDEQFDMKPRNAPFFVERRAEKVTDAAIKWLDNHKAGNLFLFLHYFDVHFPYQPPKTYADLYADRTGGLKPNDQSLPLDPIKQMLPAMTQGRDDLPEIQAIDGFYCGEITYADAQIGRLLDDLRRRNILDNAILIITADHGETMAEHPHFFNHGFETYNTTVAVPLIVRLPKAVHAGHVAERLVSNIDIMPTILDLFGMEVPSRVEGVSFARLFRHQSLQPRNPVFAEATKPFALEYENHPVWFNARKTRCIITPKFKVIHRPLLDEWELYHIADDHRERNNLLRFPRFRNDPLLVDLKQQLTAWNESADPLPTFEEVADKSQQNLRALGYVGTKDAAKPTKPLGDWTNSGL